MIRAWLRRWLGIDGIVSVDNLRIDTLEGKIDVLRRELEALKYMRQQREARAQVKVPQDWERVQAEYAANPDNYKEN